jgi:thymidylate synthase
MQWRNFNGVDQVQQVFLALVDRSNSRRLIISGWNPAEQHLMCLPPCHLLYQFSTRGEFVDLAVYQRSCDTGIGLPFNWANSALFCHVMAVCAGLKPGRLVWFGADVHLYEPHVQLLQHLLHLCPEYPQDPPPQLVVENKPAFPWEVEPLDLRVVDYKPGPKINLPFFVG